MHMVHLGLQMTAASPGIQEVKLLPMWLGSHVRARQPYVQLASCFPFFHPITALPQKSNGLESSPV